MVFNTAGSRIDVSEAQARELAGLDWRTHQRGGADRGADEAASHVRGDGGGARRRQVQQLAGLQQLRHAAVRVRGPQVVGRRVAVLGVRFGGRDHGGGRQQRRRRWRGARRFHFRGVRARLQQPQLEHVVRRRQPAHFLSELGNGLRVGVVSAVPVAVLQQRQAASAHHVPLAAAVRPTPNHHHVL